MPKPAVQAPRHPVAEACARAPVGQLLTPEQRAEVDAILENVRAGRCVRHEDVPAWLEEQAGLEHGDG